MVFFNNNRVDHAFYNNANIIAIGAGTNTPALVYNNAATKAYITAVGGEDNLVSGFEIVNFNTLGLNNIDLKIPYQSTTPLMNRSATIYYNNARKNCLIESTVKDIDISGLLIGFIISISPIAIITIATILIVMAPSIKPIINSLYPFFIDVNPILLSFCFSNTFHIIIHAKINEI